MKKEVIIFEWEGEEYAEEIAKNLKLSTLTPHELKVFLNKAPGKYAYWSSVLADVEEKLSELNMKYDFWFSRRYLIVDEEFPKKTETFKRNKVYLGNSDKVKSYFRAKRAFTTVKSKVAALVRAYEIQSWTLQTMAGIMKAELGMVSAEGSRTL